MTRRPGHQRRRRLHDPAASPREIAPPALRASRRSGARRRASYAGAPAGQQVQLAAQPLDRALLGGLVAQRNGPAQVDQLPASMRADRRRAVDQRRAARSARRRSDPARARSAARDRAPPAAVGCCCTSSDGPPRQIGQHRRSPAPPSRAADERCAASGRFCSQTPVSSVSPRRCSDRAPIVLAQRHARRDRGPHPRVGRDGQAHLGRAPPRRRRPSAWRPAGSPPRRSRPARRRARCRAAPARIRISPSSLLGNSTPRFAPAPPASSSAIRAQIQAPRPATARPGPGRRAGSPARRRAPLRSRPPRPARARAAALPRRA